MVIVAIKRETSNVSLEIKILGRTSFLSFSSISEAADVAIKYISSGKAIPKSIMLGDKVVMSESDINTYWESAR